jgi:hypothetical protein
MLYHRYNCYIDMHYTCEVKVKDFEKKKHHSILNENRLYILYTTTYMNFQTALKLTTETSLT